jgi:lysophospholipase L1-like esterase
MEVKKIVILGNSVALRNRPHVKEQSLNYGQLISNALNTTESDTLYVIENIAFGRATMRDLHKVADQIINTFGDLYIVNIGVSDAATREMSRWFGDVLNQRKQTLKVKIFKAITVVFHRPIRTFLIKLRGKQAWTSKSQFKKEFNKLIYKIQHNTNGKIIVLPLLIADARIEKIVPGTTKNYHAFNKIIADICVEKEIHLLEL